MSEFYIKNEDGEFIPADDKVKEKFRKDSDSIVSKKLTKAKEKLREELESELKKKVPDSVKESVRSELETEYQSKLEEYKSKNKELEVNLRRKTIAAEYGFSEGLEKHLGDGTEDEMRKEADSLKDAINSAASVDPPEKKTDEDGAKESFVHLTDKD